MRVLSKSTQSNKPMAVVLVSMVFFSAFMVAASVDLANATATVVSPYSDKVTFQSPIDTTYNTNNLALKFVVNTADFSPEPFFYWTLDENASTTNLSPIWNNLHMVAKNFIGSYYDTYPHVLWVYSCNATLTNLVAGQHNLTVYRGNDRVDQYAAYYPIGTVHFVINLPEPPEVALLSLENQTFITSAVPLTIAITKSSSILGLAYSLDGRANVTFAGNSTLTGLANGEHSVVVYVSCLGFDTSFGPAGGTHYMWVSYPEVHFTVNVPLQSPTLIPTQQPNSPTLSPSPSVPEFPSELILSLAVVLVLLVCLRKRREQ